MVTTESAKFPVHLFAAPGEGPVPDALATELQALLETSANGDGLTATLMTPAGTWSGAAGFATAGRKMTPDDQMSIASITKTIVAAEVMRLVDADQLSLDDLAADHLPKDLDFDTNEARIVDLLSMRSGIPQYFIDDEALRFVERIRPVAAIIEHENGFAMRCASWCAREMGATTSVHCAPGYGHRGACVPRDRAAPGLVSIAWMLDLDADDSMEVIADDLGDTSRTICKASP